MAAFIIYIIRWGVALTLLYSLFGLVMKRETLHGVNRVVLLVILTASMVLPLCQIEAPRANIVTQSRDRIEHQINRNLTTSPSTKREGNMNLQNNRQTEDTLLSFRRGVRGEIIVYMTGLILCWLHYLWQFASLMLLIHRAKRIELEGLPKHVHVLVHPDVKTPCSWMHWMILNPTDVNTQAIINHELAHIRLGHSWDMLLCELTCRMLWCLPFTWMLRQDLRDVHEYQADRCVLATGINDEQYQLLLIRKATGTGLQPVVNALNQSPIKRRFKMMYTKPSRRWVALKAAYLLPLSALALMAFARPQTMDEIEKAIEDVPLLSSHTGNSSSGLCEIQQQEERLASPIRDEPAKQELLPDSNLVKADLKEQNTELKQAIGYFKKLEMEVVLDSVMQAVGARKIREGVYVGNFQPNLNSDTLHIGHVTFLDKQSRQTAGLGLNIDENDPLLYTMTLQEGTRKDETGYYIRQLTPANTSVMHYERTAEPRLMPADKLKKDLDKMREPILIEQYPKETHVILYWHVDDQDAPIDVDLSNWAIVDVETGDRYMLRSIENFEGKHMRVDVKNRKENIYQFRFIFPPLDKKVRKVYVGNAKNQYFSEEEIHELANISRKPVQIIK